MSNRPVATPPAPRGESVFQRVDLLDQRLGQFVERLPVGREADLRPAAFEERGLQLALERLNLQRHARLAEKQSLGRLRDAAGLRGVTKAAQLLQAILLVVLRM